LLRRHLIDKLVMFVAPKIIGGDGLSVMGACGVETMDQAIVLRRMTSHQVGEDLMLEAYFMPPDPSAGNAPDRAEEA
jgi:diaminohydroxyphosphoribosylaminopyrimidine deaminase/5-amino-6-(5-phosphoribosylamino)uracil reductase